MDVETPTLKELIEQMTAASARERAASVELRGAVNDVRNSITELKTAFESLGHWANEREEALFVRDELQTAIITRLLRSDGPPNGAAAS